MSKIETKFTEGPWHVDPACDSIVGKNDRKEGFLHVADVRVWGRFQYQGEKGEQEFLENGRLIAAAPEMFDLLIAISTDEDNPLCEEAFYAIEMLKRKVLNGKKQR